MTDPWAGERIIMHVDMDAFYVSVELRRRPELRGRPVWVGGGHRGVVLSASYQARACGVAGGMSAVRARRLCPDAVVLPPDFDRYAEASAGVMAIMESITPVVEVASIDEAFLDITGARHLWGEPAQIGELIRAMVADEQGLPCSVGIAPTKVVAKIASTIAKPDGLRAVPPGDVIAFLHPLDVGRLWGVGEATEKVLHHLGLTTISDVAYTPRATLQRALGANLGTQLHRLSWGHDSRVVTPHEPERSIGSQETFTRDISDLEVIDRELLRLSIRVAGRLRAATVVGRTLTLQVRFADFRSVQRSLTLAAPTNATDELHQGARRLLHALRLVRPRIRRVGVRVEGLVAADSISTQPMLTDPDHGWWDAERAADAVVAKYGPQALQRGTLTGRQPP